jgi:hypothetical protein
VWGGKFQSLEKSLFWPIQVETVDSGDGRTAFWKEQTEFDGSNGYRLLQLKAVPTQNSLAGLRPFLPLPIPDGGRQRKTRRFCEDWIRSRLIS